MENDFRNTYKRCIETTNDIDIAMFGFGVWKGNTGFFRADLGLSSPIKDRLKKEWDEYTWLDSLSAYDPDDREDFLYTLPGIQFPLYQIEKAVKFQRPSWVFFYLAGHVLGEKSQGDFTEEEYKIVFEKTLQALPDSLKTKLIEIEVPFNQTLR